VTSQALRALLLAGAAACGAAQVGAQGATPPFEAGKHYTVLESAQPTSTDAGKVEVAEVFMFGCPGCFRFEPHLESWLERKADYVNFVRIPAAWQGHRGAQLHARAYYAAEELGLTEQIDEPFFDEFHNQQNYLDTEEKLVEFFERFGVDESAFKSAFTSFAVNAKLRRAEELIQRYRVQSTPSVVVNGKYVTVGAMAGSYEAWFAIIDDLAAREHDAANGAAGSQ
jgi:thiol:disulfide interchange protein DsbA